MESDPCIESNIKWREKKETPRRSNLKQEKCVYLKLSKHPRQFVNTETKFHKNKSHVSCHDLIIIYYVSLATVIEKGITYFFLVGNNSI